MGVINNILVATDFGEASGVALAYGRKLARSYNARLHVLHVVEDVEDIILRYTPEVRWMGADLQKNLEAAAGRTLNAVVAEDYRMAPKAEAIIEKGINPAETIVNYAQGNAIDLVVIGTHGRGAVQHLLMGNVAERVVRTASCPVLTVHAHESDLIDPDLDPPSAD